MAATKSKSKPSAKKTKAAAKTVKAAAPKAKKGAAAGKKAAASKVKAKPARAPKAKAAPASKSKAAAKSPETAKARATKAAKDVLDFGGFPAGSVTRHEVTLCLACIFKLFTNQMGLAPRTAYNEIRRHAPTVEELTAREPARPFFKPSGEKHPRCP